MQSSQNKLGLAMSGGGYRAAAFHLGTMKKLNELGILNKVDVLSTISGGSITGAYYCLQNIPFDDFERNMKELIANKSVIKYILTSWSFLKVAVFLLFFIGLSIVFLFTAYAWVSLILILIMVTLIILFQYKIFPVSKIIEKSYNEFFYKDATLGDLLDNKPLLAIGSTNIQTCRPFTFSKKKMGDSSYANRKPPILFRNEKFPLSRAVMASSCVPFAFAPITIDKKFFVNENDATVINPVLVDGGVYDNQGIQKITQPGSSYECDIIITSDAGNKLPFENSYNNVFVLLIRTMDVFMARIKNFQMMQNLFHNTQFANKQIAYLSLGWDIKNCIPGFIKNLASNQITQSVIDEHKIPEQWVKNVNQFEKNIQDLLEENVGYQKIYEEKLSAADLKIARDVGTNLKCLTEKQINCLSGHAANITELQVKLYCPTLI